MAFVPIETVAIGDIPLHALKEAISVANTAQREFVFLEIPDNEAANFRMHAYKRTQASTLLDVLDETRTALRGYHPFLIAIVDAELNGTKYDNLFGRHRAKNGLGVFTISNVPDIIVPLDRLDAYFIYYLARYTLSFFVPEKRNHDDNRGCIFDRKVNKLDIHKSMRARALCDECRTELLASPSSLSPLQLSALDKLFALSGERLARKDELRTKAKVFIGSSSEGLPVAYKIQELLSTAEFSPVVWNQGTVFGLGTATLEALEQAVLEYQAAVFIFTPDDELYRREQVHPVARDNVIFELGLFIGKLGRRRTFVVNPGNGTIVLPSDLLGITTAVYDPHETNLAAALGPNCNRIREALLRGNLRAD